jgi:hypothetical protein
MLIFALVALVPVTYLFINRNVIHRERARTRSVDALVAVAWGAVYALLIGVIIGPLGVLAGVAIGIYAFLS